MKSLRRYFSVFLCLVLLLVGFSVSANAEEQEIRPYHIYISSDIETNVWDNNFTPLTFYPDDGTPTKLKSTIEMHRLNWQDDETYIDWFTEMTVITNDGTYLFKGGNQVEVTLQSVYTLYSFGLYNGSKGSYFPEYAQCTVRYTDGTAKYVPNVEIVRKGNSFYYDLKMTFTPEKDVERLVFHLEKNLWESMSESEKQNHDGTFSYEIGEMKDPQYALVVDRQSDEAGLLGGIWDAITNGVQTLANKLSDLWTAITDGLQTLANKLSELWTAITELPEKIWNYIEEGLQSLFVPSEAFITDYRDRLDTMLENKLGAVYQVTNITFESWDRITASDEQNTITIPSAEIQLPEGETFVFGGYDVKIVPTGFEWLATLLKTFVGLVCTILFVNGLRKRYDEVMGVEQ